MSKPFLQVSDVTFYYEAMDAPVFDRLSFECYAGWTGVIGANGSGKTTLLRLACGELTPQSGSVRSSGSVIYCPQRTDDPPPELPAFLRAREGEAAELRSRLLVEPDWPDRWASLSHGERKRAQIGVALWRRSDVFALDEPTNHIDVDARRLLADALSSFGGVGILVSHDRELLDTLCSCCLVLSPVNVVMRPGGYTKAASQDRADRERAKLLHDQAKRELQRLRREAVERQRLAAQADRKRSKRGLAPGDSDAREKLDRARLTGKDAQAGRVLRQMDGRLDQAEEALRSIHVQKERPLGVHMRGEPIGRPVLFQLPAGSLPLGPGRTLTYPRLEMLRDDRVALMGPNGSGKSTLVRHVIANLKLPARKLVYLPQEIHVQEGARLIDEARSLPPAVLGDVMSYVSRLGSDPDRLLQTEQPSPGETRKLMLALGVARQPHLIVMDEPTNHLDLPSIECLEDALEGCVCGLLLVSHDVRFLRRLCRTRWEARHSGKAAGVEETVLHVSGD